VQQKRAEADASRKDILGVPGVGAALREYEVAQARLSCAVPLSPKNDMFARRLPKITEVDEPVHVPKDSKQPSATVEESSDGEEPTQQVSQKLTGASRPDYSRLGSIVPNNADGGDNELEAPLANFTRRISTAAQALANDQVNRSDSDDSDTTEEIPRNEVVLVSEKTIDTGKAQAELYANLFAMM
jgi:hypothetical protein